MPSSSPAVLYHDDWSQRVHLLCSSRQTSIDLDLIFDLTFLFSKEQQVVPCPLHLLFTSYHDGRIRVHLSWSSDKLDLTLTWPLTLSSSFQRFRTWSLVRGCPMPSSSPDCYHDDRDLIKSIFHALWDKLDLNLTFDLFFFFSKILDFKK